MPDSPRRSRLAGRIQTLSRALAGAVGRRKVPPSLPATILVAHNLLLGDSLMLAGLFKALRQRWPQAHIIVTCAPAFLPLFAGRPWQVEAVAYDPRRPETLAGLFAACRGGVDLALLPGDNRHALLARACGARWIRGLAGDAPRWKNALCDELLPWPSQAMTLTEIFALLAGEVVASEYAFGDWPAPPTDPLHPALPARYAVLHVGAGNPLRCWPVDNWRQVADALAAQGVTPVWSCGPGEHSLVEAADPAGRYPAEHAGRLNLAGMWHLLAGAALVVCLDSGIAHLAKLVGRPTMCIFGQGSAQLFGAGRFFARVPFVSLIETNIPCRDQQQLFGRSLRWVRRCARRPPECSDPLCIKAVTPEQVLRACSQFLED